MLISATLLICSCLCNSNPSGETAMRQNAYVLSIQQEIAAIKASPISERQKGKRLAVLIKKVTSIEEAERIVGQPDFTMGWGLNQTRLYYQFDLAISVSDGKVESVGFNPFKLK